MENQYKNLGYFFLLLIPLAFLGFYEPYFQYFPNIGDIKMPIHIHAFISSIWIIILIIQPILIRNKRYDIHRIIGKISYFWFPLLLSSFVPLMLKVINSEFPKAIFFSSADVTLLILFYSLAIYHRKKTHPHMRYMILTAIVFLGPTVGRIGAILLKQPFLISQSIQYALIALILINLILFDRPNRQKIRPYILGSLCYTVHAIVFYIIFI